MELYDRVIYKGQEAKIILDWNDGYFDIEYINPKDKWHRTELSVHITELEEI
jgi:hypothetical protein